MSYSNQNRFADEYYRAFHQFANVRNKLIRIKNGQSRCSGAEYERLVEKFEHLKTEVPKLTHRANVEEDTLIREAKKNTTPKGVGERLDIMG